MTLPLWAEQPDNYDRCDRCRGTGEIDCRWCEGKGTVVGPDRYVVGRTIGRRFGLKRCSYCHGRGTQRCGLCDSGSLRRT
jgi:hypothetical protein